MKRMHPALDLINSILCVVSASLADTSTSSFLCVSSRRLFADTNTVSINTIEETSVLNRSSSTSNNLIQKSYYFFIAASFYFLFSNSYVISVRTISFCLLITTPPGFVVVTTMRTTMTQQGRCKLI